MLCKLYELVVAVEARIEGLACEYARQIRFGNDERERLILMGKEKPRDEEMLMGQNKRCQNGIEMR